MVNSNPNPSPSPSPNPNPDPNQPEQARGRKPFPFDFVVACAHQLLSALGLLAQLHLVHADVSSPEC